MKFSNDEIRKMLEESTINHKDGRIFPFTLISYNKHMERINKFVDNCPEIITQLLEQNEVMRKALEKYAKLETTDRMIDRGKYAKEALDKVIKYKKGE